MHANIRMVAAMLGGILCFVAALVLEGGHPAELLLLPSMVVVATVAFGGLLALRGLGTTVRVIRSVFVRCPVDDVARDELVDGLEVLERTSLVAGLVGLVGGSVGAVNSFHEPTMVGPSIAFAIVSLIYSLSINIFFALPLKQQLLREVTPDMRLSPREAIKRAARGFVVLAVAVVVCSVWLHPDGGLTSSASLPGLLYVVGVLLPSVLVAGDSVFSSPVSGRRQLWYANALLCGGVVAVCCGLVHVFSVLDQPSMLWPGLAYVVSTVVLPVAGAGLLRMRTPHEKLRVPAADAHGSANLYFGFAGFAIAVLMALTLLVVLILGLADPSAAAAPR